MKIQIELVGKTFLFIEDFGLTRFDGPVEVELEERSDQFKATIASAIAAGTVKSDAEVANIVELIKDNGLRNATKINLGLADFSDVIVTQPEIVEVETSSKEEVGNEAENSEPETVEEKPVDDDEEKEEEVVKGQEEEVIADSSEEQTGSVEDSVLEEILNGKNADVIEKLESSELNLEQAKRLLELEEAGRNRRNIKRRIQSMIDSLSGE